MRRSQAGTLLSLIDSLMLAIPYASDVEREVYDDAGVSETLCMVVSTSVSVMEPN